VKIDKIKIAQTANRLRQAYNIQGNGIKDIFSFVNSQDIELIRYPFGKNTILGFSTIYEGKKIIVSNSSEILSREIFTIAHELGHIEFDFNDNNQDIKIDKHESDDEEDYSEMVAYYFANCLLMPKDKLMNYIELNLKKAPKELRAINIVGMQLEFNVSFSALVRRLFELQIISIEKQKELQSERNFYSSPTLFKLLGADSELLEATNTIAVPPQYSDYVLSNYENGYIPYSSLVRAFSLLGIDTSDIKEKVETEETNDLDDIFEEYI
jgi:Zn-dependent peptidase ImmA (M78 family)